VIGQGLWDPSSPIAIRIYARGPADRLDLALLTASVARAIDTRDNLFDVTTTDAYRMCNGEGDRIPGVVLDRYATVAIARFDGDAIRCWGEELLPAVWPHLRDRGIRTLALRDRLDGKAKVQQIAGESFPESVVVVEHGMRMRVELVRGQKTGAFLDQRENRRRVRGLARGARVLNLFSYTGGFSCSCALGGARHVTSVDIAHPAHAVAQETFRLNGLQPEAHTFVTSDVFAYLDQARSRGERFDLVISDPPSFAPNAKSLPRAMGAYRRLHEACVRVVARGGVLCASSCSSHVNLEAFVDTLDDAVLDGRRFVIREAHGQPCDHPTLPTWPEGRYLKFVVLGESIRALAQRGPGI
jgi:23S rRNA (cytosine1962-C5)-methyltransferase